MGAHRFVINTRVLQICGGFGSPLERSVGKFIASFCNADSVTARHYSFFCEVDFVDEIFCVCTQFLFGVGKLNFKALY